LRVVTPKRLKEYSKKNSTARIPLLHWYSIASKANWNSLADIKQDFNSVDYFGNNRYIFNIKGNDYRLIVIIIFISQKIYIRYIGTHSQYDKLDKAAIIKI